MTSGFARSAKILLATAGWLWLGVTAFGQVPSAEVKVAAYDVVSIKPNHSGANMIRVQNSQDRYSAVGVSLKLLIESAYNLKTDDQVLGLSGPADGARFDIEAKMDAETMESLKKLNEEERATQRRLMLRVMLEDRFKLKAHQETKELPIFALVPAKGEQKLKEANPEDKYPNGVKGPDGTSRAGMMMMRNGSVTGQAIPISNLANILGRQLGRQVVDKTGLTGKYDLTLTWSPDEGSAGAADTGSPAGSGPTIFTALQEQLG